jgi:putative nucleotidyltransferase with HDIG domain
VTTTGAPGVPAASARPTLAEISAEVDELPAPPVSLAAVIAACDDPDVTVGQLAQRILQDQNLTASILKLANSAFYGLSRRITTVTEAIGLLGFSTIKSLAISSHTYRLLNRPLDGYAMAQGEIWRHSAAVAMTARMLAVEVRLAPVEEAFIAGLLHDVGKVVLSSHLERAFTSVVGRSQERHMPFVDAEREVLGFDHAELGAMVTQRWNFPPELVEAIRFHHTPAEAVLRPRLCHVVHLADAVCVMLGVGLGVDGLAYEVDGHALSSLGFDRGRLERLLDQVEPIVSAADFSLA